MGAAAEFEVGQIWAWHSSKRGPLRPARITHADTAGRVRATLVDETGAGEVEDLVVNFWCLWSERDAHLETRRWLGARLAALQKGEPVGRWDPPWERPDAPAESGSVILVKEPSSVHASARVAYTLDAAASECGVSNGFLRDYVNRNELAVHYANSKMIILADDLRSWIESLPTERR